MSKISKKSIDIYALARDASHYLLIPESVAKPQNFNEISLLLKERFVSGKPLTFRSGGTSLSGQAVTKDLLVDTRIGFRKIEVLDQGKRIRVQPGVTVREVNNRLKPYGYKFGPDPASEVACTIGGVIANNSSGMMCGTETNAYKTIESLVIVFSDGSILDTSSINATALFKNLQPKLFSSLQSIKNKIDNNIRLKEEIRSHFRLKNTMGYGINAFVDYDDIIEILNHLVIGSEGTLVFVAEATFKTVPIKPFAASSLLIFNNLASSNSALASIIDSGAAAIELLDSKSLKVAKNTNTNLEVFKKLNIENQSGLLVEYQSDSADKLELQLTEAQKVLDRLDLNGKMSLARDLKTRNEMWHIRKGLYASVAGARRSGTTALLEDIAVPVSELGDTCESLINLFDKHHYKDSVIFGHARDGNIHFMLNEDFRRPENINHYQKFTEDMVELVLSKKGTLKAEHGTGRVMAPFVRRQYGDEIYEIMVQIKLGFDPKRILNPDVIISTDDAIHLRNIKTSLDVNAVVNNCVECGFCEPACPSRNLTLTPRQRIAIQRALPIVSRETKKAILSDYKNHVLDTCATDSICALYCPLGIDTGELVRDQRSNNSLIWTFLAKKYGLGLLVIRNILAIAMKTPLKSRWNFEFYFRGARRKSRPELDADLIYLPSCVNEFLGPSLQNTFEQLCEKSGLKVYVPEQISNICCGTPWKSKGHKSNVKNNIKYDLPVVTDNSSCRIGFDSIDINKFVIENLIPKLNVRKAKLIVVHPTCSSEKSDGNQYLIQLAHLLADQVVIPPNWSCCGFAGDRGFLQPKLTESATSDESSYISNISADYFVSSNRGCEAAMSNRSKRPYQNILQVLLELTN